MVDSKRILGLSYLSMAPFTGSDKDLRYRIEKITEDDKDFLLTSAWRGRFSFDNTPEDEIFTFKSDFSEEGIGALVKWLNERGGK